MKARTDEIVLIGGEYRDGVSRTTGGNITPDSIQAISIFQPGFGAVCKAYLVVEAF